MNILRRYIPFFASFLLSLILFSLMFYGFYLYQQNYFDSQQIAVNTIAPNVYEPTDNDSLNILLIACPTKNLSAKLFVLIRFDAITNKSYITAIPSNISSTVNVKTMTLSEHYDYGGTQTAISAVENMFLISIDRYIRVDKYNIKALVDYFGNINYEVGEQIKTNEYTFDSGLNTLDGARVSNLLLESDIDIAAEIVAQYIQTNLNPETYDNINAFLDYMFANCDTSVNRLDFQNYYRPASAFFNTMEVKTETIIMSTEFDEEKEITQIATPTMNRMKLVYDGD